MSAAKVAVVTDSTAYLPAEALREYGIAVVPLQVVIEGTAYDEGTGPARAVADALRARTAITTSRPAPATFGAVYAAAADAGFDAVVSVHLSSHMSGTSESARLAAADASIEVEVVDSRSLGMGLGFAALSAARVAAAGGLLGEVAAAARERAAGCSVLFYLDTLEHLRRGGRIGPAAALLGSALAVKPLLHLVEGQIQPLEKVRTATRAIARLEEISLERSGTVTVDVAVHHLASPERAAALAEHLRDRTPALGELVVSEVGAVVGAHVGPGMLAVVISPHLAPRTSRDSAST